MIDTIGDLLVDVYNGQMQLRHLASLTEFEDQIRMQFWDRSVSSSVEQALTSRGIVFESDGELLIIPL